MDETNATERRDDKRYVDEEHSEQVKRDDINNSTARKRDRTRSKEREPRTRSREPRTRSREREVRTRSREQHPKRHREYDEQRPSRSYRDQDRDHRSSRRSRSRDRMRRRSRSNDRSRRRSRSRDGDRTRGVDKDGVKNEKRRRESRDEPRGNIEVIDLTTDTDHIDTDALSIIPSKPVSKFDKPATSNPRISRFQQDRLKASITLRDADYDASTLRISRSDQERLREDVRKHQLQPALTKVLTEEEVRAAEDEEKKRVKRERLAAWKAQHKEEVETKVEFVEQAAVPEIQRPKTSLFFVKPLNQKKSLNRSAFEADSDSDNEVKQPAVFDFPLTVIDPVIDLTNDNAVDQEIDPLDVYMTDVATELDRISELPLPLLTAPLFIEDTQEEIMQQESMRDPRDKKEIVLDLDDPDAILAPIASKFAAKKKDLVAVNHKDVEYGEFRKSFWVEPLELVGMTDGELELRRVELDNVKIRGLECPKPISRWGQCGLNAAYYDIIQKQMKLVKPTAIQAQSIPAIMCGRDVMAIAKTGSGKTLAFLLPLLRHVKDQPPSKGLEGPIALVMAPTRELALQIHRECAIFGKALGLRAVCAYGGAPIKDQIADLKRGADIVICTPGRMIDLLSANNGRVTNLRRVTMLVIDEADRMFDLGFDPQIMKIMSCVRPDAQIVLFSATFPRQMEALARRYLKRGLEISVGGRSVVCSDVGQFVEVVHEDAKFVRLLEILGNALDKDAECKVLIFVDKHEAADNMLKDLLKRGYPCQSLHGALDQSDRDSTLSDFKLGHTSILIATSVAARGLDVKLLKVVVNYECPNHMEDYVHRVGRTGRAGAKGDAYTFITPDQDKYAGEIVKALRASHAVIPDAVAQLAVKYADKLKSGVVKSGSAAGYGGKGLERLEVDRNTKMQIQKTSLQTADDIEQALNAEMEDGKEDGEGKDESGGNMLLSLAKAVDVSAGMNAGGKFTLKAGLSKSPPTTHLYQEGCVAYEIEINGFPQQARWKITGKEILQEISQLTGAAVTVRGNYVPAQRPLKPGERKLYLYIEGTSREIIDKAKNEVRRSLFEFTMTTMEESGTNAFSSAGRYSVI